MTKRRYLNQFSIMLIMLFSIISQSAMALSLGEITVRSHFAEPFLAEIALPSYTADETGSIEIHIASAKQHEAMGYEFTEASKQFRFAIKEKEDGVLYIEVRTESVIKVLSISLLIEVNSVNGRIVKGYDILLSPKSMSSADDSTNDNMSGNKKTKNAKNESSIINQRVMPMTQISSLAVEKKTTNVTPTPVEQVPTATASNTEDLSKVKKLEGGGFEYRNVGAGESLSRIAQRIRPRESMHMYQVMIALYNENPDSFLNGNINNLKVGSNLKLEEIEVITDISKSRAFELIQQYAAISIDDQADVNNHQLQTANSEIFLSAAVSNEKDSDQLSTVKLQLENARMMVHNLGVENKNLLDRIARLETEINKTTKALFSPMTPGKTIPPTQNSTVIDSNVSKSETEKQSFMATLKQNQTSITIAGVGLLAISLVGARKKSEIGELFSGLKLFRKREKNIFS